MQKNWPGHQRWHPETGEEVEMNWKWEEATYIGVQNGRHELNKIQPCIFALKQVVPYFSFSKK